MMFGWLCMALQGRSGSVGGNPVENLKDLLQLEFDASFAYARAIDGARDPGIRERLIQFRNDHERHIGDLEAAIRSLGGAPPVRGRDLPGVMIETMTAVSAGFGTETALRAMQSNEVLTNRAYDAALRLPLPPDIRGTLERAREDERRHKAFIDGVLTRRSFA